jgi:outer membrane protein OmpA-like peptidoglycan-associated protein
MGLRRISRKWDEVAARGCALALAVTAALAACSSTPSSVNPFELYRSAAGLTVNDDTTGERNAQNLEAGRNEPYPNLGTVPPPPDRAMSSIDRQKLQQGLVDDRAQAKQTDANLRDSQNNAAPMGLPTPITRPSSSGDPAAPPPAKPKADASHSSAQTQASNTRRRTSPGSETPPAESSLTTATVHAVPEGDTPRPAPPPPNLPPPEKARKAPDQMAKVQPVGNTIKRAPPAPPATGATPPDAGAQPPSSLDTASAGSAVAPPAVPPAIKIDPPAARMPPPPPPADMMMPAPDKIASADAARSAPPAAPAPSAPAPNAPAQAAPPPSAPTANAPASAGAPTAAWPSSLSANDTAKPASEQTAALDPVRPPQSAPAPMAPPAAKPPEAQAALPPPTAPRGQEPLTATAVPLPGPSRSGSVSLQAAEINFASNGLTLTPDDDRRLADVVKLYDKHGGLVRVVGYGRRGFGADAALQELASFSKAIERANVVARALTQLGLASNRIVVQAAPIGDGLGEDRAEVLLEF